MCPLSRVDLSLDPSSPLITSLITLLTPLHALHHFCCIQNPGPGAYDNTQRYNHKRTRLRARKRQPAPRPPKPALTALGRKKAGLNADGSDPKASATASATPQQLQQSQSMASMVSEGAGNGGGSTAAAPVSRYAVKRTPAPGSAMGGRPLSANWKARQQLNRSLASAAELHDAAGAAVVKGDLAVGLGGDAAGEFLYVDDEGNPVTAGMCQCIVCTAPLSPELTLASRVGACVCVTVRRAGRCNTVDWRRR